MRSKYEKLNYTSEFQDFHHQGLYIGEKNGTFINCLSQLIWANFILYFFFPEIRMLLGKIRMVFCCSFKPYIKDRDLSLEKKKKDRDFSAVLFIFLKTGFYYQKTEKQENSFNFLCFFVLRNSNQQFQRKKNNFQKIIK